MQATFDAAIWNILNLNEVIEKFDTQISIATDLKLANILAGLMSHSSSHPCSWSVIFKKKNGSKFNKAKLFGTYYFIGIFALIVIQNASTP